MEGAPFPDFMVEASFLVEPQPFAKVEVAFGGARRNISGIAILFPGVAGVGAEEMFLLFSVSSFLFRFSGSVASSRHNLMFSNSSALPRTPWL